MNKYDAHSHVGTDKFHHVNASLDGYIQLAQKMGITNANIMSVPCPTICVKGSIQTSLLWEFNKSFSYFSEFTTHGVPTRIYNPENPYSAANNILEDLVLKTTKIRLNFVPLIHAVLDTPEYLERVFEKKPIAIKIHGVACGTIPAQTNSNILRLAAEYDIPIIVHTDYAFDPDIGPISYLCKENSALNWIRLFEKYNVRGFITHGAKLCKESFRIVNLSKGQFLVGISPDLLIESEPAGLMRSRYLDTLLSEVETDKVAFDVDYSWNIPNRSSSELDADSELRVLQLITDEISLGKIFSKNSESFFNRLKG